MAFNSGILTVSGLVLTLVDTGGTGQYNVESELVAEYGISSFPGLVVLLSVTGDRNASSSGGYAIDCSGLDPDTRLTITLSADVNAKGGSGGAGASITYTWDPEFPGFSGGTGGVGGVWRSLDGH